MKIKYGFEFGFLSVGIFFDAEQNTIYIFPVPFCCVIIDLCPACAEKEKEAQNG